MATILDILGSMVIRGAIVLIMLSLNLSMHNALYQKTQRLMVKQNLTVPSQVFLSDLILAGYNATPSTTMQTALPTEIQFLGDVDNNSVTETVRYYLSAAAGTVPEHRILYRSINGSVSEVARDIDSLTFLYYDASGVVTGTLANIRSVYVQFSMVSGYALTNDVEQQEYEKAFWERLIVPPNLQL